MGLVVNMLCPINEANQQLISVGPISTWTDDYQQTTKPPRRVTSYPGQLSLANPPWVVITSTSKGWGVNRHIS